MDNPLVRILVLNWNGMEHLEECFSSLVEGCQREDVEFVLLDNASTDESVTYVRDRFCHDPRVVVECLDKNYGWSGGNNYGIKKSIEKGAKYIFLLNNDVKVERNCIENLLDMAEATPDVGGVAPKMLLYNQPWLLNSIGLECSIIGSAWDRGLGRVDSPRWDEITEVVGICGGAMWLRTEVLLKTGFLPEEYSIYLDDLDLCLRIWSVGSRILTCPNAVIHHKFSATWEGSPDKIRQKYFLNTRNRFYLMERMFPRSCLPEIIFWVGVGELKAIGNSIRKSEFWRIIKHMKAWQEAIKYYYKAKRWRRENQHIFQRRQQDLFWKLIRKQPLFCPEIELPVEGWYKPKRVCGRELQAMSKFATIYHKGGMLSFSCGNPSPSMGNIDIIVRFNDNVIEHIQTTQFKKYILDLPAGKVIFEANKIFEVEQHSIAPYDIGAWFEFNT
ncbi:MAG: glycosyltransferase family 2 protein [Candidatus Hydrogenedens sp.]|nr:glycosyltransferase family 2 protein [Candidatus Hydrogenedens sp.]